MTNTSLCVALTAFILIGPGVLVTGMALTFPTIGASALAILAALAGLIGG